MIFFRSWGKPSNTLHPYKGCLVVLPITQYSSTLAVYDVLVTTFLLEGVLGVFSLPPRQHSPLLERASPETLTNHQSQELRQNPAYAVCRNLVTSSTECRANQTLLLLLWLFGLKIYQSVGVHMHWLILGIE